MRRRGKAPKGFRADDEKTLQIEFNREHEEYVERMRRERIENREKVKKQAAMQRRRLLLEKQLREEQEETARDHRLEFWLALVGRLPATSTPSPWRIVLPTPTPPPLHVMPFLSSLPLVVCVGMLTLALLRSVRTPLRSRLASRSRA